MDSIENPLVSIAIPVYNGARHLRECLASIEAQTYPHWEAFIINNCSTDDTATIADSFALRDSRFRVIHCQEFLSQPANYNRAAAAAASGAYVKFVEADNLLWPECIERMVAVAEIDPTIGIVGCYYLYGRQLFGHGLPLETVELDGRSVGRIHLSTDQHFLGSPTTLLFRKSILPVNEPLFREGVFCDDVDLCFRLLQQCRFGFVHQVLAFLRVDNDGIMSTFWDFDFQHTERYIMLCAHGERYFSADEITAVRRRLRRRYFRCLANAVLDRRGPAYWKFHDSALAAAGQRLSVRVLFIPVLRALGDWLLNPKNTISHLRQLARSRHARRQSAIVSELG